MAYLEKLIINGASYDLQDAQLRAAFPQLQAAVDAMKIADTAAGESLHLQGSMEDTLQHLRVYVSASQAGEGTPSATNVRPISPAAATVTVRVADNAAMDGAVSYDAALPAGMYGGYYDWERGVFVQTHDYVVADGTVGDFVNYSANHFYINGIINPQKPSQVSSGDLQHTGRCDSFVYGKNNPVDAVYCSGVNIWLNHVTGCPTDTELKAFLQAHPIGVVYPLATPVEHILENDPALQIKAPRPESFLDTTGDSLEVTYAISPQAYVDKKIKEALGENV